ncbi:cytochrome c1 [Castellaniella caeni]|uniref:cytochrome c1 n=1 Tax=Castellaniella caeni TaxID=266123 RepID=UPI000833601C|nr:cytochrome c1 [Castellaniella caeni]
MIKKLLGALALSLTCTLAFAEGGAHIDRAPDRITDLAALQNGAKLFVNYCLNCHSANSMRYNKLMDLGLTENEIKKNLLFSRDKVGDLMTISMTPEDAKKWFGAAPPDLSVIARAKSANFGPSGVDYIYTYLRGFYRNTTKKTGWDNTVFPSVAMPNVLWELEGPRTYTSIDVHQVADAQGNEHWERTTTVYDEAGFPSAKSEKLADYHGDATHTGRFDSADQKTYSEFESNVADLSNFLGWMAEPGQLLRKQIGVWVMLFLFLFLFVATRMNKAYWKHVR